MVLGLASQLYQAHLTTGILGGASQHFHEIRRADVVGTRAGNEKPAGAQHLQSAEVEFLVATHGRIEVALGLGEGWRVKHDGVVAVVGSRIVLEQVEGVSLDPFDLPAIQRRIAVRGFQSRAGTLYARDAGAVRGEMKSKPSLIAKGVKRIAVSKLCDSRIIFPLVEECARLLALQSIVMEL